MNFVGMAVVNESTRLATFHAAGQLNDLFERHARASQVGGLPVFLLFFAMNAALIAFCIRLVARRGAAATAD